MRFFKNAFSIGVKTHRLICVHTSVFMAFSSVSVWTVENTNTVEFPAGAKFSVNKTPQHIVRFKLVTSKKTRQNAKKTSAQNAFIWTDDEVELLLTVTNEYNWKYRTHTKALIGNRFKANMRTYSSDLSNIFRPPKIALNPSYLEKTFHIRQMILLRVFYLQNWNLLGPSLDNQSIVAREVVMGAWFGWFGSEFVSLDSLWIMWIYLGRFSCYSFNRNWHIIYWYRVAISK